MSLKKLLRNYFKLLEYVEPTLKQTNQQKKTELMRQFDREIIEEGLVKTYLRFMNSWIRSICSYFFGVIQFGYAQSDSTPTPKRIKIDGVAAVIGDYVILDSDIEKAYIDLQSQEFNWNIEKCSLLGKLMEDKLYAHHAEQDSLEVSDAEINDYVGRTIDYFVQELGSMKKVLEFYKKKMSKARNELFDINRVQQLSQRMQASIVEEIEVTPEEVRTFFDKIPVDQRPVFGAELEIAQIVIDPTPTDQEVETIRLLETMRNDVLENGSSFASKGFCTRKIQGHDHEVVDTPLIVSDHDGERIQRSGHRLREGEISQPFQTDFGWHVVTVDKIRGQLIDVRHVLLVPEVSSKELREAKQKLD